jgi:hypothetical protein
MPCSKMILKKLVCNITECLPILTLYNRGSARVNLREDTFLFTFSVFTSTLRPPNITSLLTSYAKHKRQGHNNDLYINASRMTPVHEGTQVSKHGNSVALTRNTIDITYNHNVCSTPNIIRMMKPRNMKWAEHVAYFGKMNAYRVLVGRPWGDRPSGIHRNRLKDNIKMELREIW